MFTLFTTIVLSALYAPPPIFPTPPPVKVEITVNLGKHDYSTLAACQAMQAEALKASNSRTVVTAFCKAK